MENNVDLGYIYGELVDLRNRLSNDGSKETFEEDHLLLDWALDTFEFVFNHKEFTKDLENHLKELYGL